MTWVAVPKLPQGTWACMFLACGHVRVRRAAACIENWEWESIFCLICLNYRTIVDTGTVRV